MKKNVIHQLGEVELVWVTKNEAVGEKIKSPTKAIEYIRDLYDPRKLELREFAYAVYLNRDGVILGTQQISIGSTAGCIMDVKFILKIAIDLNASSIILSHNHPSGNLMPSESDKHITEKIKKAAGYMDIQVVDHVIITREGCFSFSEEGLL